MENKDNTQTKQAETPKDNFKAPVTVDIAGTKNLEVSTSGATEAMEIETGLFIHFSLCFFYW